MALVFSPSSGSHGSFHCEEASTSSIHPWASPVLFVAVCLHLQRQEEVFLSFFFFFNLPSPNLSYPIPWYLFFLIFFFFLSQLCRRLTHWFWLSFSSEQPSWLPNLNQGLPAISSHSHVLFFIFLIKLDVILFIHLLFYHLSPTTSM